MIAYILRRLLATIPVMGIVAVFVFFLLRFAPGDPAAIIAGEDATVEHIAAVRAKLGLDRPVLEQFVLWLGGILQGDFGTSIFSNMPVTRLIAQRLEPTLALLSEPERIVLQRLSVFTGGWTLEAAEFVCAELPGNGSGGFSARDRSGFDSLNLIRRNGPLSRMKATMEPSFRATRLG